ncbi:MAG: GAF domain-containing protein [Ardenticatenaceae bacterium]|nr:GAF domain-containing protein [Ardenticatenaceae bacterium]
MSHSFGIQKQAVAVLQQDYGAFVATAVDDHIQRQYEDLQSLAHVISLGLLSADEQVIMLANIPQHYDVGESVMLVVEDGAGVTAVYPQNTLLLDASVQQMQQAVTDSATGIAFVPDISSPDAYALVMGAPLLRPDDSPYGMVLWRTDLAFLQGILDSSGVKYDGYAYLLNRSQTFLAYVNQDELLVQPRADHSAVSDLVAETAQPWQPWSRLLQTQIYRGLFGDWVLRQETAVANLNLSIIVETPITTAYAPILQMIYETIGFLIVVAIIALSLGYYFSHKIVIPLRQLSMAAARISDGDMSVQLDVDSRNEFGLVAAAFNRMTAQLHETVSTLEKSVEERTTTINRRSLQIQAAAATARDATSATELNELLNRAVNLVPSRFGYYHAGIFLVDESEKYAVLRAATGTVGQEMLRRQHRLLVGSEGIVGHVIATGSPYITSDTHRDPVYWPNPLLPETRSEMGLPLRVGDRVIGAMNVQSRKTSAFEEEDITILQILTDQLAVAIEKTRLFEKTQAMLTERLHTIVSNIPLMLFAFDRQGIITGRRQRVGNTEC